jgi:hypothetical protein
MLTQFPRESGMVPYRPVLRGTMLHNKGKTEKSHLLLPFPVADAKSAPPRKVLRAEYNDRKPNACTKGARLELPKSYMFI